MEHFYIWLWIAFPYALALFVFIVSYLLKYFIKSRDFDYTYKLATTDGLTELHNHRFFQEQMRACISQCEKSNSVFSLVYIDIDFFKKFNDKYGHQVGDAVLKEVGQTLKKSVRNIDYVCRYGGEEMAIILNGTGYKDALTTAQKLCDTIAQKSMHLSPEIITNVTISLGVSTYPKDGKTPTELIEAADKNLYLAKENGRNQVGNFVADKQNN